MRLIWVRHYCISFIAFAIIASYLTLIPARLALAMSTQWLQFDFDSQHTGNNPLETIINAGNVSTLKPLFQVTLPTLPGSINNVADGAPVSLSGVTTKNGSQDLLFVTTKGADLIALDAHSGAVVWTAAHHSPTTCIDTSLGNCYTTSSPVIDPGLAFIYSYGLDGKVHKHAVGDGTEITTGGWPETATLKVSQEKGSSALSMATTGGTTYLYVTNGGYPGDGGDYQGHVTAINLSTGSQNVFNALCSDQPVHLNLVSPDCTSPLPAHITQAAVWARVGTVYDVSLNKLFISTGNGNFDITKFFWGDSVLALNPDGTGAGGGSPLDSYTPSNQSMLNKKDQDLGSTAPAILPIPPGITSTVPHLAVQSGKDANLRLLNLAKLSNAEFDMFGVPQGGEVLTQPAIWVNPADNSTWAFVANDSGISGLQLQFDNVGVPKLVTKWVKSAGGTSPVIANNVLYYAGSGNVHALDPITGNQLWTSTSTTSNINNIHWESPIVINGVLYITDESAHVTAYWIGILPPTATAMPSSTATIAPSSTVTTAALLTANTSASIQSASQPGADPVISAAVDQTLAIGGDTVKFTLMVRNQGVAAAPNVVVSDPFPSSLVFVRGSTTQGTLTTSSNNMVTFTIGTVNPGQTVIMSAEVVVSTNALPPIDLTNIATLTWMGSVSNNSSVRLRIVGGQLPSTGEHP